MFYGTIRSFNANTGYGFIISDEIEGDVYAHITDVTGSNVCRLIQNQSVSFDLAYDEKHRRCAKNIRIIK